MVTVLLMPRDPDMPSDQLVGSVGIEPGSKELIDDYCQARDLRLPETRQDLDESSHRPRVFAGLGVQSAPARQRESLGQTSFTAPLSGFSVKHEPGSRHDREHHGRKPWIPSKWWNDADKQQSKPLDNEYDAQRQRGAHLTGATWCPLPVPPPRGVRREVPRFAGRPGRLAHSAGRPDR